jgi:type I restriction enzyme S subunit
VTGELTADWRAANPPTENGSGLLARILTDRHARWTTDLKNKGKKYVEPAAPDSSSLPSLPEGWIWASLEQLIERLRNGISVKPAHAPPGIPILRISAVRAMAVHASQRRWLPSTFVVGDLTAKTGDLLFTRYNGNPELVGVCGRYRGETDIAYPDKIMCAAPTRIDPAIGDYLELATNAGAGRRFIQAFTKTSTGQHGVSGDTVKKTPIPLPPAGEMREIVARYAAARDQVENGWNLAEPVIDDAAILRQSILAAAFRGDLAQ